MVLGPAAASTWYDFAASGIQSGVAHDDDVPDDRTANLMARHIEEPSVVAAQRRN